MTRESARGTLIGREVELGRIGGQLAVSRLVTLTGPGGTGKTRLAVEIESSSRANGAEAAFVDLSAVLDPELLLGTVAAVLGVAEGADRDVEQALVAWLKDRPFLLVVDNLEQVLAGAEGISRLVEASPQLRVLATSRIPLAIPGETEVAIAPLALPDEAAECDLESFAATQLFLVRARAIGRLEAIDAATCRDIVSLCRQLDGLPLALELAAARTRILSPGAILARLNDPTVVARSGGKGRHRSLEAVLDWSFGLLSDGEKQLLALVSHCPSGFDLRIAAALAPDVGLIDALDNLAAHGLVRRAEEVDGQPRFMLLETVRSYATARLTPAEGELLSRQLSAHFAERLAELEPRIIHDPSAVAWIGANLGNIRSVLAWSETHDPAGGLQIVATIWRYCLQENLGREGIGYFRRFLDRYRTPDALRAISLVHLARLLSEFDHELALAAAREGASLAAAIGDLAVEAEADPILAGELTTNGLPEQAKLVLARFAEVADKLNDRHVDVQVLLWKGIFELQTNGDPVVAGGYFSTAGAEAERIGDTFWLAICLGNEAESVEIAHRPGALDLARRGVDLIRPHSSGSSLNSALTGLSMLEARHGSMSFAVGALREAAALSLEGGLASMIGVFEAAEAVALVAGRASDVARLAGAVDQVNRRTHMVLPEMQEAIAAPERTAARKMIGELKWEAAFRKGQAEDPRGLVSWVMEQDWDASLPDKERTSLRHGDLTRREVEVLTLIAEGRSDGEIGDALFISPKTASVHVSNIKGKLGLATRLEVALAARDLGLDAEMPHVERGNGSAEDPRTILDSI